MDLSITKSNANDVVVEVNSTTVTVQQSNSIAVEVTPQQPIQIDINRQVTANGMPAGGTTGEVLAKQSGTSYDTDWQTLSELGAALKGANADINSLSAITGRVSTPTAIDFALGGDTSAVGRLNWNNNDGTLDLGLKGGNVNLQIGQELLQRVYNNTGATITDGQIVIVEGSQGQRLTVKLALANSDLNSATILGMATESIANNSEGFIAVYGVVNNVNTSGIADGTILWLSPTTAGAYTATKPVAPDHLVMIGYVVKGNSTGGGSIYVHVQNGYELSELHDVLIVNPTNGQVLTYNATTGLWENEDSGGGAAGVSSFNTRTGDVTLQNTDVTGALGYTPVQPNGTGATGTWAIDVSGNAGTVTNGVYTTATQTLTNKTITAPTLLNQVIFRGNGVANYTPFANTLASWQVDANDFQVFYLQNINNGTDASVDYVAYNDESDVNSYFIDMGINSSNYSSTTYPIFTPNSGYVFTGGGAGSIPADLFLGTSTVGSDIVFFTEGVGTSNIKARFKHNGKFLLGTDTDTGELLQVNGTAKIAGATEFGASVLLSANPSSAMQAATKEYVDNAVSTGIHIHEPVRVEQGSNLNATYNNGASGVGATLTNAGTQTAIVVDGVTLSVNDRVLVYGQTNGAQNGVYVVSNTGSGSTNWVLTRASDANTYGTSDPNALGGGDYFYVTSGNTGAGESYVLTTEGVIVFGTTLLTFTQFSGAITYTGGQNIDVTGQTISLTGTVPATNGGTGANTVTTGDLLYGSGTNAWSKLPIGAAYKSLVVNASGTQVEWNGVALNQSNAVSGQLAVANGGTGAATQSDARTNLGLVIGTDIPSPTGTGASGTWSISINGNASTVTNGVYTTGSYADPSWLTSVNYSKLTGTVPTWNQNTTGQAGSVANTIVFNDSGTGNVSGTSYDGSVARTISYNTFGAAADDGTNAFGTWNISVSGNAGTVTNGVYTSGSYADPAWVTSLAGSKITGSVSSATNADAVTNGVYTTGSYSNPTWIVSLAGSKISGAVTTATNLAGGGIHEIAYQTGSGTTGFIASPSTANTFLEWDGSTFTWSTSAGGGVTSFNTRTGAVTLTSSDVTGALGYTPASSASAVVGVGATAPIASSGGTNPTISISQSSSTTNGYLSSTDWNTFNNKQSTLVSGTNIKTINGSSVLGSGDLTVSGSFTGGTLTSELILAAGTTSSGSLNFQSGTLQTSPVAGDMEYDGDVFYGTVGTNNRGVIPSEYFVVLQSNNTLTSQTAAQPLFDGGGTGLTNGALSLGTGTFFFECTFYLTSLSATSGSFGFALGGTATKTQYWEATAKKSTLATAATAQTTFNTAANTTLASASTTTTGFARITGTIDITVAGTIIPQVSLTQAAAGVINTGSYFRIRRMGSNTVAYTGNWS